MDKCIVEGCNNKYKAKGYCNKHYHQVERHGKITPEKEHNRYSKCLVEECNRKPEAHGYCNTHYEQIRKHGKIMFINLKTINNFIIKDDYVELHIINKLNELICIALFDLEDINKLIKYHWITDSDKYIQTFINDDKRISMHRLIMNPKTNEEVDHINHITYDNRKCNLRIVNRTQNNYNHNLMKTNTSGQKGVSYHKTYKKWEARVWIKNKTIHLGYYDNFEDAVKIRKEAEEKYYGEYTYENSMEQSKYNNIIEEQ
jgi:hypothetical protein